MKLLTLVSSQPRVEAPKCVRKTSKQIRGLTKIRYNKIGERSELLTTKEMGGGQLLNKHPILAWRQFGSSKAWLLAVGGPEVANTSLRHQTNDPILTFSVE